MPPLWPLRLLFPGIPKMADRNFSDILEEITGCEQAILMGADPGGHQACRLEALRCEAYNHPAAAAGRDLPPIIGTIGG